jgi:hypothetical protein
LKNKIFLIALLVINAVLFFIGFIVSDTSIMMLAVASYASVLIGFYINSGPKNNNFFRKDE